MLENHAGPLLNAGVFVLGEAFESLCVRHEALGHTLVPGGHSNGA